MGLQRISELKPNTAKGSEEEADLLITEVRVSRFGNTSRLMRGA